MIDQGTSAGSGASSGSSDAAARSAASMPSGTATTSGVGTGTGIATSGAGAAGSDARPRELEGSDETPGKALREQRERETVEGAPLVQPGPTKRAEMASVARERERRAQRQQPRKGNPQ